jgi:hypothetical protein
MYRPLSVSSLVMLSLLVSVHILLTQLVTDRIWCRAMSAAVENSKIQRPAGIEEQGISQGFWQVLRWILVSI